VVILEKEVMVLTKALAGVLGDIFTSSMRLVACAVVRPAALTCETNAGEMRMQRERMTPRMYFFMQNGTD
jgi:hypothetical protein